MKIKHSKVKLLSLLLLSSMTVLLMTLTSARSDDAFDDFRKREQDSWQKFINKQKPADKNNSAKKSLEVKPTDTEDTSVEEAPPIDLDALAPPALAAVLPTLPTITSWLPPVAVTNSPKYAIPEDPCLGLKLLPDDEPNLPTTPQDLLATSLAKDINSLTKKRYRAVVTATHEVMRLILGQMPPERENVFEWRWMQLYDFPSARIINYLDKLNPLLVEFLALNQAAETALMEMGNLRFEAEMAAAYENEDAARSAMEQMTIAGEALTKIKQRIIGVSTAVEALGDPPNPREEKCRTRRKFKECIALPDDLGAWVLQSNTVATTWLLDDGRISTNGIEFSKNSAIANAVVPAKFLDPDEECPDFVVRWRFDWAPGPPLIRPNEDPRGLFCRIEDAGVTYGDERVDAKIWMLSTNHIANNVYYNGRITSWEEHKHLNGVYHSLLTEMWSPKVGGFKRHTPQQAYALEHPSIDTPSPPALKFVPKGVTGERMREVLLAGEHGWTMVIEVRFKTCYNSGIARYYYRYDKTVMPPAVAPPWPPFTAAPPTHDSHPQGPTEAEIAAEKLKQEKIEFYEGQIKSLEEDIQRYQNMLSSLEDNSDIKQETALRYMLVSKRADLQSEKDQIATLKTGNFTRTRTQFDEIISMQMQANSRKMAVKIHEDMHRRGTIDRLVNLMPESERADLRLWVRKSLGSNSTDLDQQHKVAEILSKKVQDHYTAESQDHMADADAYQETIDTLEDYQVPATYMMYATPFVTGGPALALAYGITSGGIDGYATGGMLGPDHKGALGAAVGGVVTSARYLSAKFDYALTFYEGYTMPNENGQQGGIIGGLKNMAITYVKRKTVQKFTQFGLKCQARIQAQQKQAKLDAWRDEKRKAEFDWQRRIGKERVKSHQMAYKNYKELKASGASPMALKIAQQKLTDKTIAVMHSPHAKGYLKFNASKAEQYAYNSTSRLHINHVINEFKVELQKQGFDTTKLKFKPMRNSGNTTPGMDTDIGMTSTFANGRQIFRIDPATGKQSNMDLYRGGQAAQSIFNTIYRRNSGGRESAESWTQITTTDSLESYRDKTWLNTSARCREGLNPKYGIDPNHASDAARVTEQKLHEIEHGHHSQPTKFWEKSRGTAKDIDTKVVTLLKQKIINTGSQQKKTELRKKLKFYQDMSEALKLANHDPVAAEQAVKQLSGFDPVEAMKMTTIGIEMLGKE